MSHEPSNAELMTLLRHHVEQSERRDGMQTERIASMRQEVKSDILKVVNQQAEFNQRLIKVEERSKIAEGAARKALDSQAELEGSLLAEVGALGANDKKQNAEMADIKKETEKQSLVLANVELEASVQTKALTEILTWKRAALILFAGMPMAWTIIEQLIQHWK